MSDSEDLYNAVYNNDCAEVKRILSEDSGLWQVDVNDYYNFSFSGRFLFK